MENWHICLLDLQFSSRVKSGVTRCKKLKLGREYFTENQDEVTCPDCLRVMADEAIREIAQSGTPR